MLQSDPPKSLPGDASEKWLERGIILILVLACAVAFSKNRVDPDFWGHVQYGIDARSDGLPTTATYTYTSENHRWINHEVVAEFLLVTGLETVGQSGLLIIKCLLGLAVLWMIYRSATWENVPAVSIGLTLLLVAVSIMQFWALRPQLLSFVFFALMIAWVDSCFRTGTLPARENGDSGAQPPLSDQSFSHLASRVKWLWLLVPLFSIWANSHGGFVAGYCILVVYLLGRIVELGRRFGRKALGLMGMLGAVMVASGLATFFNAYGIELHRWLLHSITMPRPEIVEWRAPELISVVWIPWWVLVATFVGAAVGTRHRRDPIQFALLGLTLWQACLHRRHIVFFAILFGFWMPSHIASLLSRFENRRSNTPVTTNGSPTVRWLGVVGLFVLAVAMSINLAGQLRMIAVRKDGYPVAAFQYMADHQLGGRLVVQFKWAQYAIAAFAARPSVLPATSVAFDGRFRTCYPQQIVDSYFDFAKGLGAPGVRYRADDSAPFDDSRILRLGTPDLVLIDRRQTHAIDVMQGKSDEWTVLYQDGLAQLWGRAVVFDNPEHTCYVPVSQRRLSEKPQQGVARWPALPTLPTTFQSRGLAAGNHGWSKLGLATDVADSRTSTTDVHVRSHDEHATDECKRSR